MKASPDSAGIVVGWPIAPSVWLCVAAGGPVAQQDHSALIRPIAATFSLTVKLTQPRKLR